VLWPAESVYGGTWSSGPVPVEVQWVELMIVFKWSWQELLETPAYVRRVCWDLLAARREAQRAADERAGGG
jgi:hypothetical protein